MNWRSPWVLTAFGLVALLFSVNCYRAVTQSLTHDEALTWQLYLLGPARLLWEYYDPNHHFLATLLMRASTTLLGHSEAAIRLPAVLAGALFFYCVLRMGVLVFGASPFLLLWVAMASLNPIVLDFLVAARGYGLALALFSAALLTLLLWTGDPTPANRRLLRMAAVFLALSVWANLTLLFPVAIVFTLALWSLRRPAAAPADARKSSKKQRTPPAPSLWPQLVVPVAVLAVLLFLCAPLQNAEARQFYVGKDSLSASGQNFMEVAFAHNSDGIHWTPSGRLLAWASLLLPLAALLALWLGRDALRGGAPTSQASRPALSWALMLGGGAIAGSLALLILAHAMADLPYPVDRTGLYFHPLLALCLNASASALWRAARARRLAALLTGLACAAVVLFVMQWQSRYFRVWRYDAANRAMLERIAAENPARKPLRVGISWEFEPSCNYYRITRGWHWMAEFTRDGPRGVYDYYLLSPGDSGLVRELRLQVLLQDPLTGNTLARGGG